ncbi:MAG: hypothetical protein ACR2GH_22105 [Pseudonocardia sp.]
MSTPIPPHYLGFRIVLVVVLLAALAGAAWWVVRPEVLAEILTFLGVG